MKRIDVLPDDVLLEIFDFYLIYPYDGDKTDIEAWQSLVHVCRRWRSLVFGSPRRLNLRLFCAPETPARDALDVWPALPLVVKADVDSSSGMDNIIAALEQSNRVCRVDLSIHANWQLEQVLAAMQVPFPELVDLWLFSDDETRPAIPIPDSFLGGSAPRLRHFYLLGIPFPGLPKPLFSATHLVQLNLTNIPHSGYISPEAIVALLSALSSLGTLFLGFQPHHSRPDLESLSLPPPKPFVLPALDKFHFDGATEYLEELVTRIDTPQLVNMHINFLNQIDFDCPRLAQFINHTPTLRIHDNAHVQFDDWSSSVAFPTCSNPLEIVISCREPDWQLSTITQVCNSLVHPLSRVKGLYIEGPNRSHFSPSFWMNDAIENSQWLQLLLPFTAVENLYLSEEFAPGIAAALQKLVGSRITEVLPSLQNIFVEALEPSGPFQENIGHFVAARQLSDRPIAISVWDEGSSMKPW